MSDGLVGGPKPSVSWAGDVRAIMRQNGREKCGRVAVGWSPKAMNYRESETVNLEANTSGKPGAAIDFPRGKKRDNTLCQIRAAHDEVRVSRSARASFTPGRKKRNAGRVWN